MTVCKYMSARWGVQFIKDWHLRITPPAEFNDPFELKSPTPELFSKDDFSRSFEDAAVPLATEELGKHLAQMTHGVLPSDLAQSLAIGLIDGPRAETFKRVARKLHRKFHWPEHRLREMALKMHAAWPQLVEAARQQHQQVRSHANAFLEHALKEKVPALLGVLCLSKNPNQPLMWAHYAQSHSGLMIEFEPLHPAFNRRRSPKDEFGFLRDVRYAERRPRLNMDAVNEGRGFEVFALTKSSHWAYEEEQRFIWPLELCAKPPEGSVHLIDIPSSAVVSVTLGCNATMETETALLHAIGSQEECEHIEIRRAHMHHTEFELVYQTIARQ